MVFMNIPRAASYTYRQLIEFHFSSSISILIFACLRSLLREREKERLNEK